MGKIVVLFSVKYRTKWGENICISGSNTSLGKWKPNFAVHCVCNGEIWSAFVLVDAGVKFEYKYFVERDGQIEWENGVNRIRCFFIPEGELVEVRDVWHLAPNFFEDVSSTTALHDVCLRREHPTSLPHLDNPPVGQNSVIFEVPVPLISPKETVRLIGGTRKNFFWSCHSAQGLHDKEFPLFQCMRNFGEDEFPLHFKFVLTHDEGRDCDTTEQEVKHVEAPSIVCIDENSQAQLWTGALAPIKLTEAIKMGLLKTNFVKEKATPEIYDEDDDLFQQVCDDDLRPENQNSSFASSSQSSASSSNSFPMDKTKIKAQFLFIECGTFTYPSQPHFRAAGVVIPVFSLRSKRSVGCGEFCDIPLFAKWCSMCGLRCIQLLPVTDTMVHETKWVDSYPYSSVSSFALHPIYVNIDSIDPLPASVLEEIETKRKHLNKKFMDYEETLKIKLKWLHEIYEYHLAKGLVDGNEEFEQFVKESEYWLPSYAAFKAISEIQHTTNWHLWPYSLKGEKSDTLKNEDSALSSSTASLETPAAIREREKEIEQMVQSVVEKVVSNEDPAWPLVRFYMWVQYILDKQLREASAKCAELRVFLKGDVPIGVDAHSADTWYFRRYFRLNTQAGAPPDAFAVSGQNWNFPTYNWDNIMEDNFVWWANRLKVMSRFFHSYRIDHILGFFRIWEIPLQCRSGLHARFVPGSMVYKTGLAFKGVSDDNDKLTKPYITRQFVESLFGIEKSEKRKRAEAEKAKGRCLGSHASENECTFSYSTIPSVTQTLPITDRNDAKEEDEEEEIVEDPIEMTSAEVIEEYLKQGNPTIEEGDFVFKAEFETEAAIEAHEASKWGINDDTPAERVREFDQHMKKFWALKNSVCLYKYGNDYYVPRFNIGSSLSYQRLDANCKEKLLSFCDDYFYRWHEEEFRSSGHRKLSWLKQSSRMLMCGEDLGHVAHCVPHVMNEFNILGLRVQRMPSFDVEEKQREKRRSEGILAPGSVIDGIEGHCMHPSDYSERVVATTSTHDMPPLRAWWELCDLDDSNKYRGKKKSLKRHGVFEEKDEKNSEKEKGAILAENAKSCDESVSISQSSVLSSMQLSSVKSELEKRKSKRNYEREQRFKEYISSPEGKAGMSIVTDVWYRLLGNSFIDESTFLNSSYANEFKRSESQSIKKHDYFKNNEFLEEYSNGESENEDALEEPLSISPPYTYPTGVPRYLPTSQHLRLLDMHFYSPAMLAIFPFQDIVAIGGEKRKGVLFHSNPWEEWINQPSNRKHYWKYRILCNIETLLRDKKLIELIRQRVEDSGRLKDH
ncbi:putative glycoside hydrolase family 77 protein [Monocercomonoides exilis]|uniref:putative glycoside hydrolase family 77 protein n=1 Tax=Monocercomonoides exilis TaxID=2049356 RepID=UPI003559ADDC|nr:putative glycoside hydrolase family 77 protein [Monocercomonoides exilis]|eukprot:MONOS_4266.1-p1 / transcript=MONOS_4266.1 / gene=MONOS_4266 / organism=Monocercomonoides_exilis_PA203 / gene_product=glycoside hydrolase family 77 protein / transcript_product=glycoside hydrolase family 77 protein / location=Mono_scaffold00111:54777-58809(-) / protein_length=1295 / sequence_SO=supercontig / SO=protein_coding / is_pseudo=false